MNINSPSHEAIDSAYTNLFAAYMQHNREAMISCCKQCQNMGIPQFHERANKEVEKIYALIGIQTYQLESTVDKLPDDVLNKYAVACMNVLFEEKMRKLSYDNQHALQVLSKPAPFRSDDVLYTQSDNQLTVENFLKVIKYALSIASIIDPDNKAYSYANASTLALQGIDDALNNKSQTELTNHTLHVATDFLANSVKESLDDTNAKRGVAISALLVNLAIDFLVK